jgi:exodeoxyribonuclease-3
VKVCTWNVNSIRARHDLLVDWLRTATPDVVCLQETKVVDDDFPTDELSRLGYEIAMAGQKTYNGVAIVARHPIEDVRVGLDGDPLPEESRAITATVQGIVIMCVYVPNGKSVDAPSFPIKLAWLGALTDTARKYAAPGRDLVVCGDFNVAPEARDVHDPQGMAGQLHFHPDEHAALAGLTDLGLVDVFRKHHEEAGLYSWWDYRGGAFRRNLGLRIDLMYASPSLAARCTGCDIDAEPRKRPKPSDHTPVVATFD